MAFNVGELWRVRHPSGCLLQVSLPPAASFPVVVCNCKNKNADTIFWFYCFFDEKNALKQIPVVQQGSECYDRRGATTFSTEVINS